MHKRFHCLTLFGLLAVLLTSGAAANDSGRLAFDGKRSELKSIEEIGSWRSPHVDVARLLAEDDANLGRNDIPFRVGHPMDVDLSPGNAGTWEELSNGDRLWRLKVETKYAVWMVLGFDEFKLPPGAALSVANRHNHTVMGPYTADDVRSHGELWFPPIKGDMLVAELYWPAALADVKPRLHLGTVSHGYRSWGNIKREDQLGPGPDGGVDALGFGDSGSCNIDTACPEGVGWEDQTRSVVMVLAGGSGNCSGAMINTTAGDCRPMMLTAAHCGENGPSTTLGFNFVRPGCNSGTPPSETNQTLTGGTLRGNFSSSDFTLIEMDNDPPEAYGAYYSGWSRDPNPALNTHVISHPRGDVKKIAFDADPPVNGSNWGSNHWRIDDSNPDPAHLAYEWGTTEPASSGSPLFDHNKRIIGQLHGGTASCSSDTYDEYGKLSASWTGGGAPASRASDWLDPLGTGALFVDGVDQQICLFQPAGAPDLDEDLYNCSDTMTITLRDDNIPGDPATVNLNLSSDTESTPETVTLTQINPGEGRYTGSFTTTAAAAANGDGALSVADGDTITVSYLDADDGDGNLNVTVTDIATADCAPPIITNVQSSQVTGNSALITWDTNEPADSSVTHGLTPPGSNVAADGSLVVSHALLLTGLDPCSDHFFSVASTDAVGNAASDNNAGTLYTFATGQNVNPQYPSTDTPIAIGDNATHNSVISVPDDETVLDIQVGLNITHTYTGDLDITLVAPNGTRILLVADAGGGGDNYTGTTFDDGAATPIGSGSAPFTGSFQPTQALSGATGISSLGNWTLEVIDDAGGDTGSLDSWTLTLLFPAAACGPNATYDAHNLEGDTCASGGGNANGYWNGGEQIQFSVIIDNNGTAPLTGVTTQINPITPGVVMLDGSASYADLAQGATGSSLAPHFTAKLPLGLTCGSEIDLEVVIQSNEGSWNKSFSQVIGEVIPGGGVAFSEDFESGFPPSGWSIVDGGSSADTWYADDAGDPAGCANTDPAAPLAGTWAAVDSDCPGSGTTMDEELISPVIDVSAGVTVTLEFDHYFRFLGPEFADVDVRSTLTGGAWVNVAQWTSSTSNPQHSAIDITAQAAGVNDLQVRWHYYNADFEWYWYVDNVVVNFTSVGSCNNPECLGGPSGPPPIPDGNGGTQALQADRMNTAGTSILIDWDAQCAPVNTNLIYGPLSMVSSYTVSGGSCAISDPELWDPAPAGDLWFLLVSDDGSGTESSWGTGNAGERNGLLGSGTCANVTKDPNGVCP